MDFSKIFKKYRWNFGLIFSLIFIESVLSILFPLFIGIAIDQALEGSNIGLFQLGALGIGAIFIGVGRRIYDSRFYARVYQKVGSGILTDIQDDLSSVKSASLTMIQELIEFFEHSLPQLLACLIGLVGVITIIATMNIFLFFGSILSAIVVFLIFWFSSARTILFNKSFNDELERQVDVISENESTSLNAHLKELMKWNIKLSDLEATNMFFAWLILIAFLVASIKISISYSIIQYGALLSLIMYVFQYVEYLISLPHYYQSWLRLKEILGRTQPCLTDLSVY